MRAIGISSIRFETDYSDLLDMTKSLMGYPSFASEIDALQSLHDDFEIMNLVYILWSKNGWTDSRKKDTLYIYIKHCQIEVLLGKTFLLIKTWSSKIASCE